MSTEESHQSRGGLKRHTKMRIGSTSRGARSSMTRGLLPDIHLPQPIKPGVRRIVSDWVDHLNPLEAENARLLLRQQIIDRRADLRALEEWDEEPSEDVEQGHGGFLHAVWFDRPDDAWPFYAEKGRLKMWQRAKPILRRKRDEQ